MSETTSDAVAKKTVDPAAKKLADAEQVAKDAQVKTEMYRIALKMILAEPYGCPACDSGKLRGKKPHWDECGYGVAQALLAQEKIDGA